MVDATLLFPTTDLPQVISRESQTKKTQPHHNLFFTSRDYQYKVYQNLLKGRNKNTMKYIK